MQVPPFLEKNKILVSAVIGALIFIGLGYWFIFVFLKSDAGVTTTSPSTGTSLLPKNFVMISNALNKDKLSLKDKSFLDSYFIKHAKDFTTVAPTSTVRGRENPFAPYDFTRSSR